MTGNSHLKALEQQEQQRRLSKADLLQPKIVEEDVYIEKLGGSVKIRSFTGEVRSRIRKESGFQTPEFDSDKMELLSIVYSIIEPELTKEDILELNKQDASILDDLSMKITMLNMLGQTEELKKESSPTES